MHYVLSMFLRCSVNPLTTPSQFTESKNQKMLSSNLEALVEIEQNLEGNPSPDLLDSFLSTTRNWLDQIQDKINSLDLNVIESELDQQLQKLSDDILEGLELEYDQDMEDPEEIYEEEPVEELHTSPEEATNYLELGLSKLTLSKLQGSYQEDEEVFLVPTMTSGKRKLAIDPMPDGEEEMNDFIEELNDLFSHLGSAVITDKDLELVQYGLPLLNVDEETMTRLMSELEKQNKIEKIGGRINSYKII